MHAEELRPRWLLFRAAIRASRELARGVSANRSGGGEAEAQHGRTMKTSSRCGALSTVRGSAGTSAERERLRRHREREVERRANGSGRARSAGRGRTRAERERIIEHRSKTESATSWLNDPEHPSNECSGRTQVR